MKTTGKEREGVLLRSRWNGQRTLGYCEEQTAFEAAVKNYVSIGVTMPCRTNWDTNLFEKSMMRLETTDFRLTSTNVCVELKRVSQRILNL